MQEEKIKEITDRYLQKWVAMGVNAWPGPVEPEMADKDQDPKEEWNIWHAIDSRITDGELEDLEKRVGYKLPTLYKTFLQYKHFYDLQIAEASFCRHPVKTWSNWLLKEIFDGWPTEYLIEKGLIPFAVWSDWGMLCFDTSRDNGDHDYPIVLWDHEIPYEKKDMYDNFYHLMIKLDEEDKAQSKNMHYGN